MPTITAITLDSLLEPGPSKFKEKSLPKPKPPNPNPSSMLERRNGKSVAEMKVSRPQIRPELYATPESTRLPLSPSPFSPSPYIINHKRRGPPLVNSFSEISLTSDPKMKAEERLLEKIAEDLGTKVMLMNEDTSFAVTGSALVEVEQLNGDCDDKEELESSHLSKHLVRENEDASNSDSEEESEDFFDPQESMSIASNTDDENSLGAESSQIFTTPKKEFFNSSEEQSSSEHARQDAEYKLREVRLNLLMEMEKRKQAEEALNKMKNQWLKIRQQLSFEGLMVVEDPTAAMEGEEMDSNPSESLCQQIYLARFVSEAIGRGRKRAEMEIEMEAQTELKNLEINRLSDRIRFYETINHEMSRRNQEAVETGRRERVRRRKRKQEWIWGSVAAAITLGAATLAWSYVPSARASSSSYHLFHNEQAEAAK